MRILVSAILGLTLTTAQAYAHGQCNAKPKAKPKPVCYVAPKPKPVCCEPTTDNRLQILVGKSRTDYSVSVKDCCSVTVQPKYEPDVGLQYLHDFGNITGSVMGTHNNNFYIGLGINF